MKVIINNSAGIEDSYLRLLKWRLIKIKRKFNNMLYAEVYIKKEGSRVNEYQTTIKIGIPGNDIVLKDKGENLGILFKESTEKIKRYLSINKSKT